MLRKCAKLGPSLLIVAIVLAQGATVWAASPSMKVVGNKVVLSSGKTYVPEGISVYGGLEGRYYRKNTANTYAQIKAAAKYWHANTVRLQVAESNMYPGVGKTTDYNRQFLSDLVNQVDYAHKFGLDVVVNDQTEFTSNTPSPTNLTLQFWRLLADRFKADHFVIFDIFNEPRLVSLDAAYYKPVPQRLYRLLNYSNPDANNYSSGKLTTNQAWRIWRDGGQLDGVEYRGMQSVVSTIRHQGAPNLIWVEGTYGAHRLPPKRYLLSGSNLVYSIHHPNLNRPSSWRSIGTLAAIKPVVEGEWAQYQSAWAECFTRAYQNAPRYLDYLNSHHIGVIAWSLQANSLLRGRGNLQPSNLNGGKVPKRAVALRQPNRLKPNYTCTARQHGQGIGRLLQKYFASKQHQ